MIKRKIVATGITFVIAVTLITIILPPSALLGEERDVLGDLYISTLYVLIGLTFYGFPITILIDFLTRKFKEARFFFALTLHLFFGLLPIFLLYFLTVYSFLIALGLFIIDEICRIIFANDRSKNYIDKIN